MNNKHNGCVRGFIHRSEAWCGQNSKVAYEDLDQIMVGMYHPDGGTTGEFAVRWKLVGRKPVPRLEVYDDGWSALQCFGDMLAWMASVDNENVTPKKFADALRRIGVKDMTERTMSRGCESRDPGEREYASWVCSPSVAVLP